MSNNLDSKILEDDVKPLKPRGKKLSESVRKKDIEEANKEENMPTSREIVYDRVPTDLVMAIIFIIFLLAYIGVHAYNGVTNTNKDAWSQTVINSV